MNNEDLQRGRILCVYFAIFRANLPVHVLNVVFDYGSFLKLSVTP